MQAIKGMEEIKRHTTVHSRHREQLAAIQVVESFFAELAFIPAVVGIALGYAARDFEREIRDECVRICSLNKLDCSHAATTFELFLQPLGCRKNIVAKRFQLRTGATTGLLVYALAESIVTGRPVWIATTSARRSSLINRQISGFRHVIGHKAEAKILFVGTTSLCSMKLPETVLFDDWDLEEKTVATWIECQMHAKVPAEIASNALASFFNVCVMRLQTEETPHEVDFVDPYGDIVTVDACLLSDFESTLSAAGYQPIIE